MGFNDSEYICSCHIHSTPSTNSIEFNNCCRSCCPEDQSGICYCSNRGAVWSSSCKCHVPRHTLFWVSSQVRQDAIAVYYACNQILVTPYNTPMIRFISPENCDWPVRRNRSESRIELSLYLSCIAPNALQHIRRLEWFLPISKQNCLRPRTRAWSDYLDTILLMEHAMNLPALTFTINMAASELFGERYRVMSLSNANWRWYEAVVLPVRRLGEAGLRDFFVYLRRRGIEYGRREHHEKDLERAVMGKGYDSANRGKPAERMYTLITKPTEARNSE
jgi:hypothetical protein